MNINTEKDFLYKKCLTPDCGVPIKQVELHTENPDPKIFKDDDLTKRMLKEWKESKNKPDLATNVKASPVRAPKPRREQKIKISESESVEDAISVSSEDNSEALQKKIDDLERRLAESQANEKALNRQLSEALKSRDSAKKDEEKAKKELAAVKEELKVQKSTLTANAKTLSIENNKLKRGYERLQNENAAAMINRDEDLCKLVHKESWAYREFVSCINQHYFPDSEELPVIYGLLSNRIDQASDLLKRGAKSPIIHVELEELLNSTVMPNVDHLVFEGQIVQSKRETIENLKEDEAAAAASASSSENPKTGKKEHAMEFINKIVLETVAKYPNKTSQDQVFKYFLKLKKENNNSLKGLTYDFMYNKICSMIESGKYFFHNDINFCFFITKRKLIFLSYFRWSS